MVSVRPRAFVLGVCAVVAGCGSILGLPPAPSDDEGGAPTVGGASSGATNRGGTTSGAPSGAGGEGEDGGASGSSGSSNGGRGGSAGSSPSTGGRSTGGTGTTPGGAGGQGGEGATGEPEWPTEGEPCATPGALSCVKPASVERLVCEAGRWQATESCQLGPYDIPTLCDRRTGTCGNQRCDEPGPVPDVLCNDNQPYILVCGPDLVTWEQVDCVFGCNGPDRCRVPGRNQFVVHPAFDGGSPDPRWPSPLIPVCWSDPMDGELAGAREAIRLAVDGSLGRPMALAFTGWGACPSGQARVELSFVDDCAGELARIPRIGYPGPGRSLSIELCKSYYDPTEPGVSVALELEMLPFIAMHAFGHVVGLEDVEYGQGMTDVMMKAFEVPLYQSYGFNEFNVQRLRSWYGGKPPGSLASSDGRCLTFDAGSFALSPCDGSSTQRWDLDDRVLRHTATSHCLRAGSTAGSVELAACSGDPADEAWISDRVRWQTFADECVSLGEQQPWPIATARCRAGQPDEQSFAFEFGANGVRIRVADGNCVVPLEPTPSSKPSVQTCTGDDHDLFEAFAGRLGRRGYLLTTAYDGLQFDRRDAPEVQDFWISGAFLFGLGPDYHALTLTRDENGTPTLSTTPYDGSPRPNQIFDYHF